MQTQNLPTGYTLVTGQTQHWNNDSAPLLRRQAAFCGSVDDRVLSGPQQNITAPPLSQNLLPVNNPTKIPLEENVVTPFNINAQQGYLGQPQVRSSTQTNHPILSTHEARHKAARQPSKPQTCLPTQNGPLPGSVKCNKADFVESLVDVAAMIIESIWPNHSASTKTKILPLRVFIRETLQRSRTSFSTLQTALFYLFRVKDLIPRSGAVSSATKDMGQTSPPMSPIMSVFDMGADGMTMPTSILPFPSPPLTPAQAVNHGSNGQDAVISTVGKSPCHSNSLDPVYCARRMFLASLIVASKFLQDKNYSNKAWAKITGLSPSEINHNEIAFLRLIDYRLFVPPPVFARWSSMLINYINHSQTAKAANATQGDAYDSSVTKLNVTAKFNGEANIKTSCSSLGQPSARSLQAGTPVPSGSTPTFNNLANTLCQKTVHQPNGLTNRQVNSKSWAISETVASHDLVTNCILPAPRTSLMQNSVISPKSSGLHTLQPELNGHSFVQQSQISKVRYVRECISNIRNQQPQSESTQRLCLLRNSSDSGKPNQNVVRPPLGRCCKSHIELSPYPTTTPARTKASLPSNASKRDFCVNQPTHFVGSSSSLSSSSPVPLPLDKSCEQNPMM